MDHRDSIPPPPPPQIYNTQFQTAIPPLPHGTLSPNSIHIPLPSKTTTSSQSTLTTATKIVITTPTTNDAIIPDQEQNSGTPASIPTQTFLPHAGPQDISIRLILAVTPYESDYTYLNNNNINTFLNLKFLISSYEIHADNNTTIHQSTTPSDTHAANLMGISAIYPVPSNSTRKYTAIRSFQSFEKLRTLLALYHPFCIIPPLFDPSITNSKQFLSLVLQDYQHNENANDSAEACGDNNGDGGDSNVHDDKNLTAPTMTPISSTDVSLNNVIIDAPSFNNNCHNDGDHNDYVEDSDDDNHNNTDMDNQDDHDDNPHKHVDNENHISRPHSNFTPQTTTANHESNNENDTNNHRNNNSHEENHTQYDIHYYQASLLHLFLQRLYNHPIIGESLLLHHFLYHFTNDETELFSLMNSLIAQYHTFNHKINNISTFENLYEIIKINQENKYFPRDIYNTMCEQLEQNIVPANFNTARASVWNICSTTLSASQGIRVIHHNNTTTQPSTSSPPSTTADLSLSTNGGHAPGATGPTLTSPRNSISGTVGTGHGNAFYTPKPSQQINNATIINNTLLQTRVGGNYGPANTSLSSLNNRHHQHQQQLSIQSENSSENSPPAAIDHDPAKKPQTKIMLGDIRSEEDGIRVEQYLNALSTKLISLSKVLYNYDNHHTSLASSLGYLGGAVLTWSRFELFHHEDIRTVLDQFSIALSRPYVETTPNPIRNQIIDYMMDIIRQVQAVKSLLDWRLLLAQEYILLNKKMQEQSIQLSSSLSLLSNPRSNDNHNNNLFTNISDNDNNNDDTNTAKTSLKDSNIKKQIKLLTQTQQKQLQYVNLMHSYMIIEIAYWRKIRRTEINRCVRSYAVSMKTLCAERRAMWEDAEYRIGSQLRNVTPLDSTLLHYIQPPSQPPPMAAKSSIFDNFQSDGFASRQ